ncbi:PD40 domain-containing protein [Terriglobus saanensis]|uniref:PD40 domain-containing protein n=1 Tax=Terriglobus saanensis TaxID=870903 RepID=UPI0016518C94|nr:PD40 domain-containing protein [Terriglobus saanensis]
MRISRFLRYVTETALDGRAGEIKETSIGVSVYDKAPSYDPKLDTVVRSEARRLRLKLEGYFEEEGQFDPIRIWIPKGAYLPIFEAVAVQPSTIAETSSTSDLVILGGTLAPSPLAVPPASRLRRILLYASFLALGLSFGLGALLFVTRTPDHWRSVARIIPLTTFLGESYQPNVSPDGKSVAFIWNNGGSTYSVYVVRPGGKPLRVTAGPGTDIHPVWSPDGNLIAFLRVTSSGSQVRVVSFPGGSENALFALRNGRPWSEDLLGIRNDTGPSWSSDGKGLIVSDVAPSGRGMGLYRFDLNTHELHSLTNPSSDERDLNPTLSSDGKWLAYARFSSYDSSDVFIRSLLDGRERRLTSDHTDVQGLAWSAGNREIVFSSNRGGAYGLWTIGLDGGNPSPISATGESAIQPAISRDGQFLVYADFTLRSEILKIGVSQAGTSVPPVSVAPSIRSSHSAQFSPDGSRIAFVSDRSGKWELWVSSADGKEASQLTNFDTGSVGSPRWSPDGLSIAFDARPNGRSAIFVISPDGQGLRNLSPKGQEEKQPAWSSDGKWIYFDSNRAGSMQLWKMTTSGSDATSVSQFALTDAHIAPDGKSIFYTNGTEGLWQMPLSGGSPVQIPGLEHCRFGRLWTISDGGIYYVNIRGDRSKVIRYDLQTHSNRPALTLPRDPLIGYPSLSYSPSDNAILFATKEDSRSDLMMLWAMH